jgi:sugar transferase (PEP-CTERM system associated)
LAGTALMCLYIAELYKTGAYFSRREVAARLLLALTGTATAMGVVGFAAPPLGFSRLAFAHVFVLAAVGLTGWRLSWAALRPAERLRKRVLVLGVGPGAAQIAALRDSAPQPFSIIGFIDDALDAGDHVPDGLALLGKTDDLLNLVDELQPDLVLVALADMRRALPLEELLECRLRGLAVQDWATFYEKLTGKVFVRNLRPSWLIFSDGFVKNQLTQTVKRATDLVLAAVGLVACLPLMAVVALAIKLDSRGPVLFRQARVGQHGRIFVVNKFRSMTVDAERNGAVWAVLNDPRVTRVGKWLRRLRLDELPQFMNVLIGDMSFIGPRPERPEFVRALQRRIPFYMERHSVKPGITGWAQVRHQYAASVEDSLEKLQYDLYYVKNLSPLLDLLILLSTIQVVLFARGSR